MNRPTAARKPTFISQWQNPRPGSPIHVLIVDDDTAVREFANQTLRQAGYQTVLAADGAAALRIASTLKNVDVLLTDFMMPDMNGDELMSRLREISPAVKVIFLTGFGQALCARHRAWEDEVVLDKPCTVNALLRAMFDLCVV